MKVPYDPIKDLMPVELLTRAVLVSAISPKLTVNNLRELVANTKAHPGSFNFGSAGNGTITQLSREMVKLATGGDMTHVPYRCSGPAINNLLGGRIQDVVESVLLPYVKAGQMRAVAVADDQRWALPPEVPTVKEQGYSGVNPSAWYGVFVPAGTPPAIVAKLSPVLMRIVQDPALKDKLDGIGMVPTPLGPNAFARLIRNDIKTNGEVIRKAHITLG